LQQAADAGNPEAHIQRVLRLPDEQRTADNPFVIRSLRAAEGQARAHMMLAVLLGLDSPEAVEHLIKAFDGGLPEATAPGTVDRTRTAARRPVHSRRLRR